MIYKYDKADYLILTSCSGSPLDFAEKLGKSKISFLFAPQGWGPLMAQPENYDGDGRNYQDHQTRVSISAEGQ